MGNGRAAYAGSKAAGAASQSGFLTQLGYHNTLKSLKSFRASLLMLTAPRWLRLVKYRVFQSSPPNAMLVVAGAPWTALSWVG
jgi:hypothetical protein